jgi:hypothetical protein
MSDYILVKIDVRNVFAQIRLVFQEQEQFFLLCPNISDIRSRLR